MTPISKMETTKPVTNNHTLKDYNVGYTDAKCNHINDAENYANEREYVK